MNLLSKWQRRHRLIGSVEPEWIVRNVILDSLHFLEVLPRDVRLIADVGSGAGIPGIPISIVREDLKVTLIEARRRCVSFLSTVIRELHLSRVEVLGVRAEDVKSSHRGRFDAVVMRCAGEVEKLLPKLLPLVRSGGVLVIASRPPSGGTSFGDAISVQTYTGAARWFRRHHRP